MGCCVSSNEPKAFVAVNNQGQGGRDGGGQSQQAPSQRQRSNQQAQGAQNGGGNQNNGGNNANGIARIQYLQNPTVEKVIQNQASGEGIKRVPCYETPMTKHELEKWRKEFWETRTQGSQHIWQLLRNACDETPETAEALIIAAGLQMPQNSLTLVIDENGVYYRVPICCINDPLNYSVDFQNQKLREKPKPAEKQFSALKVRSPKGDCTLQCSNLVSISDFKQMYIDKLGSSAAEGLNVSKIRMFCLGKELKDELFLYTYDIVDEMTVQVMIIKD